MSCNGCRVLRKGCSDTCVLRPCLQWIDSPESQAHATIFVAKFFGRAGLMSFISAVPESQRSALFQSLLFEACGRTVNPVTGAVGLLGSGSWDVCQSAVETVLRGGKLDPLPDSKIQKRRRSDNITSTDLGLSLRMSCVGSECKRSESQSMESGESGTSSSSHGSGKTKLLDLFC